MKTDKQLYAIFAAQPEWIFELTEQSSPGECELKSVALKAIDQTADAVIVPRRETSELTVIEFQFQDDPEIYARTAIEMALLQQQHGMRRVRGMVFFRYASHDPKTEPWCDVIQSYTLRDLLERLAERRPDHPLVAVFQPVLMTSDSALEARAAEFYTQIKYSELESRVKSTLEDVFVNWLDSDSSP